MKFLTLFLLAALLALSSAAYRKPSHPAKCFYKIKKCCWKFRPCGFVIKKKEFKKRCDFKVCKPYCFKKCYPVCKHIKVPRKVCHDKSIKVCPKPKYDYQPDHYKPKCKYITKKVCYVKYEYKKECKKVCKKYCKKRCYFVHAICIYEKIFKFHKFCPKLECGKEKIKGDDKKPDDKVSKKGKFVEKKFVKRIVKKGKGKGHY